MSSGDKATREGQRQTAELKAKARQERVELVRRALQRDPTRTAAELGRLYGWKPEFAKALVREARACPPNVHREGVGR